MAVLRWGLIGCGDIAGKRIARAFRDLDSCRLIAVNRSRHDLAGEFAREFGAKRWHRDWRELLRDGEIDAVYIATPPMSAKIAVDKATRGPVRSFLSTIGCWDGGSALEYGTEEEFGGNAGTNGVGVNAEREGEKPGCRQSALPPGDGLGKGGTRALHQRC